MSGPTPPLAPIRPATLARFLDDGRLADLRAGTLELLEEVGVHCPSASVRRLYAEHGARVDEATGIVRLPAELVLDAMGRAPRGYVMGARDPAFDLVLDGSAFHVATDGCGTEVLEADGARRASTAADVATAARLADALPAVAFYWPMLSAGDHPRTAPLHELLASYGSTVKHVQTETVMGERFARAAVEMATVIAGDEATRRARPPLSALICTIAPLAQDDAGMEGALVLAEAGIPVGFMSMATAGSTGPATVPGTVVAGDAEIVAALALVQLVHPGAPVFHSLMPGMMEPHSGAYLATPWENEIAYVVGVELAHAWGVPTLAGVFGTDARTPGWQGAAEAAVALTLCALAGAETGAGMGLLESCALFTPEQLVLDADLHERVRCALAGFDTSRESLALDVVRAVGPRGTFLAERHTRDEMRRRRFSPLTGRTAPDGTPIEPVEASRAEAARILATHRPEPLDEHRARELARIVAAADREAAR